MRDKTVALLGAGGMGCCAALELANRGYTVHLFERREYAVAEASYASEGKIHLGLIYARDDSLRTAKRMIDGALSFEANLKRWVPFNAADSISTPFLYGVHEGSLQNTDELIAHYKLCADYYDEQARATKLDYLGLDCGLQTRLLTEAERPEGISPEYFPEVFETTEYSVDPRVIASQLRQAIDAHPAIRFYPGHEITGISENKDGSLRVSMMSDAQKIVSDFPQVVNTAWYRRLALDRPLGIVPPGNWSHRYKFANRINIPLATSDLPSLTGVLGPFGDLVNFGDQGFYLSWYPTSRTGMSTEESPPEWDSQYTRESRMEIFRASLHEWEMRCGALAKLEFEETHVDPDGAVIYALGTTDVDDGASGLHDRYDIGIQTRNHYHSLDTGKYTLMPFWGVAIADRLDGII